MDNNPNNKTHKKASIIHRISSSVLIKKWYDPPPQKKIFFAALLILLFISFLFIDLSLFKIYIFSVWAIIFIDSAILIVFVLPVLYLLNSSNAIDLIKQRKDESDFDESEATKFGLSETDFDAVLIFENDICISQNKTAEIIFGYSDTEAIGKSISQWIVPEDMSRINEDLSGDIPIQYEISVIRKDSSKFQALVQSKMIYYNNRTIKVKSFINITPQKKALNNLKLLESVIDNSHNGIIIAKINPADLSGPTIIYINDAYVKMTGYSKDDIIGNTPRVLQGIKTDKLHLKIIKEAILKYEACDMELLNYKKNGNEFWTYISIFPISNIEGEFTHWVGIKRDITDQKKREVLIHKAMVLAQEKEKIVIGRELHDNVQQLLVASLMSLGMIKNLSEKDQSFLNESKKNIKESATAIRNLSHELTPSGFEDSSLKMVFEKLLNGFNAEKKLFISMNFEDTSDKPLLPELKLNLYRIVQEQVHNIFKHSKASEIKLSVIIEDFKLKMRIYDNGIGFDIKSVKKDGIGLNNIRNRIEMFNGTLIINTSLGKGFEMLIEIPL